MRNPDLEPAARRLVDVVRAVPDDALGAPTPCPDYSVGDLLDHIGGLAVAFTDAASKTSGDLETQAGGSGDASRLGDDWRTRIPRAVEALGAAWADADAWTGMTSAGGIEMPGEVAGMVALDEIVIHGWDLARAIGAPFEVDEPTLAAVHEFVAPFSEPGQEESRAGLFGPVIPVADDAPLLDRVIGMTGRDPAWSAS